MTIRFENLKDYFNYHKDDKKVSKERIAGILGISESYLYLLITGKRYASYELAKRMSLFFNIPIISVMKKTPFGE